MYSPRFLLVLVAALCVADAAFLQNFLGRRADASVSVTGSESKASSTGGAASSTSTPSTSSPSSASTTPPASSSTTEPPSSSATPTSTPAPTSTPSSSTQAAPTSTPAASTSQQPTSQQQQPTEQPTSQEETTPKSTYTSFVTSTSTQSPASTTKSTPTPGLNSDKDGATSGMPVKTRNTVIGVVVGIGGAILLGAAGMVAYRIWGRKKQSEESDGLMSYDLSTNGYEKHEPSNSITSNTQRTPFQSTLDNYHQPSNVNPSSNF
ncbi:Mid2-like cell wall stress sensor [Cordyceps militaris]|uniref:Mid2-like cell wall stress sensor n=1 Tax=Cordyceps militaris TaxID=73501 RepID=A0A2H4SDJ4_CORMI|nr:Mid2-like cell wall stress sensor [Cordyceps militaris]